MGESRGQARARSDREVVVSDMQGPSREPSSGGIVDMLFPYGIWLVLGLVMVGFGIAAGDPLLTASAAVVVLVGALVIRAMRRGEA